MAFDQFLFEVRFAKTAYVISAPGKQIFVNIPFFFDHHFISGNDISFWGHLHLYSFCIIYLKSYHLYDSFLEQFNIALQQQRDKGISRENLNLFFHNCRRHYSIIEHIVNAEIPALKILVRMASILPLDRGNVIIGSEAARQFSSIILRALSDKFALEWPTIDNVEWISFRNGLVVLCCLKLLHRQQSTEGTSGTSDLLSLIKDETRQGETVLQLLDLLRNLQCTLSENEEVALYKLIDKNHFELKHLELATSLETYVSYLTQLMMGHRGEINQLEEDIQNQLNRILTEKRFTSKK